MSNNTIIALSAAALLGIFSLFVLNMTPIFKMQPLHSFVMQAETRGSAVLAGDKPYTLNFSQQKDLINEVNRFIPVEKKDFTANANNFAFQKVVLYRFAEGDVELLPITVDGNNIIFNAPAIEPNRYLRDISEGALATLLNNSFDK